MFILQRIAKISFFAILTASLSSTSAFAYVDPGTGAYVIQALLALFAAIIFYIRHPLELIKTFIRKFLKKK